MTTVLQTTAPKAGAIVIVIDDGSFSGTIRTGL